jgi:hypothetical protein
MASRYTQEQKEIIRKSLLARHSLAYIHKLLGGSNGTLSEEIRANGGKYNYIPNSNPNTSFRINPEDRVLIKRLISEGADIPHIGQTLNKTYMAIKIHISKNGGIQNYSIPDSIMKKLQLQQQVEEFDFSKDDAPEVAATVHDQDIQERISMIEQQIEILVEFMKNRMQ